MLAKIANQESMRISRDNVLLFQKVWILDIIHLLLLIIIKNRFQVIITLTTLLLECTTNVSLMAAQIRAQLVVFTSFLKLQSLISNVATKPILSAIESCKSYQVVLQTLLFQMVSHRFQRELMKTVDSEL